MTSVFYRSPGFSYPKATHADGMYIIDSESNSYLDMSGGAAVSCLGHGHPGVINAITEQLSAVEFAHTAFFTNEPQELLATSLAERFGDASARVYFTSGGSEANETAMKLSWQLLLDKAAKKIWPSHGSPFSANVFRDYINSKK